MHWKLHDPLRGTLHHLEPSRAVCMLRAKLHVIGTVVLDRWLQPSRRRVEGQDALVKVCDERSRDIHCLRG